MELEKNKIEDESLQQWLFQSVTPKLVHPSTQTVTVALMTPSEFRECWELPLSVCISWDPSAFKLLACDAKEIMEHGSSGISMDRAISHIFHPASSMSQCLYLWPGDQSQEFEGYPTEVPLQGPFTVERLKVVFQAIQNLLANRKRQLVGDFVGLGITFLKE